jgi:potassium-transporting ATPase KdpC subunit
MAGGIISLALVLVYMAHTCVAWKGVRTTRATPKNDHRKLLHEWEVQNEIPNARLSHFAWQLGRPTTQRQITGTYREGHVMFFKHLRTSVIAIILLTALTGLLYPLAVTGIAQLIFPGKANGSMIVKDGKLLGSELIGQPFSDPKYFWSRLSATGPFAYNAGASSGSNYGPLNPALLDAVKKRIKDLKGADPQNTTPIPIDLVTASGSGLDPHISVAAALYQLPRVARNRHMNQEKIRSLVDQCTEGRHLGLLGEPHVNVLKLNLALNETQPLSEKAK